MPRPFGETLRELREKRGLSVNQLGMYSGVSPASISKIENGHRGVPKPATIFKLAQALKIPYAELMDLAGLGFVGKLKSGPAIAEQSATSEPDLTPYINILKEFEKELGITLADPDSQKLFIDSLKLIKQIQGLKS